MNMEKASDLLKQIFDNFNSYEKGQTYIDFFSSWSKIAGLDLSSHTNISDIRNGFLIVQVDHPGWMQMLQMKQNYIINQVKKRYPELGINAISIRLVNKKKWSQSNDESKSDIDTTESKSETIECAPIEIEDERLKGALDRLRKNINKRR
jgi:hypothetical protein